MTRLVGRRVATAVACLAVGFAAWYGYAPSLLPRAIGAPLAAVAAALDPGLALVLVGAAAGVFGLLSAWAAGSSTTRTAPSTADRETEAAVAVLGRRLSTRHERTVAAGGPAHREEGPVWARLRDVVVDVHRDGGRDRAAAEALVDRGEWTDDRYAAAFLTATTAVDYPWYHRLYAWLYPERAHERRVERALRAAERACGERLVDLDLPADDGGWRRRLGWPP